MISDLEPYIPAIIEAAKSQYDANLARVILHGSAVRGGFNANSDIDLAVLLYDVSRYKSECTETLRNAIPVDSAVYYLLSPHTTSIDAVERYRNFDLCYEGRVCAGMVLYDDGRPFGGVRLTYEEARREIIDHYLTQAEQWLEEASNAANISTPWARFEAGRASCRALHAVLVAHGVDPSPKLLRWNLRRLHRSAAKLDPSFRYIPSRLLVDAGFERTARRCFPSDVLITERLIAESAAIVDLCRSCVC